MSNILEQEAYRKDIIACARDNCIPWEKIRNKTILISGATGMIGSALIDILMKRNELYDEGIKVVALSRNADRAKTRLGIYFDRQEEFSYYSGDVCMTIEGINEDVDYVIHAASNTHPKAYATDPIGTITANVDGTRNLLELCKKCHTKRFLFVSSVEIYGENRGDVDKFDEKYLGYIDCNTMRAGYPESKRLGEALCHAYKSAYGIDFVIARLSRVYGPTLLDTDTKALSQFIHKAVNKEDIVLKSEGNQLYSYTYVTDAAMGLLVTMLRGVSGEAYNVADKYSDITLKELAGILADIAGKEVVFELPDKIEAAGYSKATKALLDATKIEQLGWEAKVHMREGLEKTIWCMMN